MNDSTYRFDVEPDGTITRGRVYRLPTDWSSDAWSHYWEGDSQVAFYDEGFRGRRVVDGCNEDDAARAIAALTWGGHEALDRLAVRLIGSDDACFTAVDLDRGTTLYALSWGGTDTAAWRDEIEAVWNGDIYRIEVEEYHPYMGGDGPLEGRWLPADEYPDEMFGEDKAQAEFEKVFPLDSFPAERLVGGTD